MTQRIAHRVVAVIADVELLLHQQTLPQKRRHALHMETQDVVVEEVWILNQNLILV